MEKGGATVKEPVEPRARVLAVAMKATTVEDSNLESAKVSESGAMSETLTVKKTGYPTARVLGRGSVLLSG